MSRICLAHPQALGYVIFGTNKKRNDTMVRPHRRCELQPLLKFTLVYSNCTLNATCLAQGETTD